MNIFDTKRGLNLAAMILGTSSMVAPSLHALTQAQKNAKRTIENWPSGALGMSHIRAINGCIENGGIDVNYKDEGDDTLLTLAASEGDTESVKRLLELRASPFVKDGNGKTPVELAQAELERLQEEEREYIESGKRTLEDIPRGIENCKKTIAILKKAMRAPLYRTHGTTNPWGHRH
jgi:hypothetical protein